MKLFLLAVALIVAFTRAIDTCQDSNQMIGQCNVFYHVCNHVDGTKLMYVCDARDGQSGKHEQTQWFSSPEQACQDSTQVLFQNDLKVDDYGHYPCNCQVQDVDQASCHLEIAVCFYFASDDDVKNGVLTYRGYAFDKDAPTDHKSQVDGYVDPQEAGHAAANQLFADFPDTAKKCGAAEKQFVQPALNVTSFLTGKFKRIVAQV